MRLAVLPTEILVLGVGVILLIVQLFLQSALMTAELGRSYNASPRDDQQKPKSIYAGRADRAFRNLLETFPVFVGLALALAATSRTGGMGALGAQVWIAARVIYVPLYLAGIPYIRTVVWLISLAGLLMMLTRLLVDF